MAHFHLKRALAGLAALTAGITGTIVGTAGGTSLADPPSNGATTPIQHLVVIFQENVSFDHYFGTYPHASNTDGQPFTAKSGTQTPDNLLHDNLLTNNPNRSVNDPSQPANPKRYGYTANDLLTCDQDHNYADEQKSFDNGKMDLFPQTVGSASTSPTGQKCSRDAVMNYYDGNTVTAMWNYAQRYAMSDNSYGSTFGPSSPGAINLASGDTGEVDMTHTANHPSIATSSSPNADVTPDGKGGYSLTSDAQPYYDDCSTRDAVGMQGRNIGDVLNAKGLSWGWFQGGFRPSTPFATAAPGQPTATFTPDQFKGRYYTKGQPGSDQGLCNSYHAIGAGLPGSMKGTGQYGYKDDYIAHHEPFQYYASTANPHHLTLPTDSNGNDTLAGLKQIGTDTQHYDGKSPQFDTPNHNYDSSDFDQLVAAITRGDLPPSALPAVSFLKAPGYQDGHAAYSDPIDEQEFLVKEINALQQSPDWKSTAIVISYDDSDGWYDHAYPGIQNPSHTPADSQTGAVSPNPGAPTTGDCGAPGTSPTLGGEQGRCGYGPRLPLVVISPYAKSNAIDRTLTDQSSILRFVEDNWGLPTVDGDSYDTIAHSLTGLFDFPAPKAHGEPYPYGQAPNHGQLLLDPVTGQPTG